MGLAGEKGGICLGRSAASVLTFTSVQHLQLSVNSWNINIGHDKLSACVFYYEYVYMYIPKSHGPIMHNVMYDDTGSVLIYTMENLYRDHIIYWLNSFLVCRHTRSKLHKQYKTKHHIHRY